MNVKTEPYFPSPFKDEGYKCPDCAIVWTGIMGYSCPRDNCPVQPKAKM